MKKRVYIFIFGMLVGYFGLHKKGNTSIETVFDYTSEVPVLFTITEQEMKQKSALVTLFEQNGENDTSVDASGVEKVPEQQEELLALLPEGSNVDYCKRFNEEIEVRYEIDGMFYHLVYTDTHVMKMITIVYNEKEYSVINTDNKEFECNQME